MRQIASYTIEDQPIARGGMGQIFKGYDSQGNTVALKEILPEFATDLTIVARLNKEVEFLMKVEHPSIVKLYSAFRDTENQNFYIVMELVDGLNIEQYIAKNGPIPYELATEIMIKVLDGMQCVHNANIVHRDIKPSNIMILPDMSVRLLDFGVAKDMEGNGTIPGSIIGTTGYMSPEQANGNSINFKADIYSLGCVFFYMLTGQHAFNTLTSEFETKDAIINNKFPKLSKFKKGIPDRLQKILDRATERDMTRRYDSCLEFLSALRNGTVITGSGDADKVVVTLGRDQCDIIYNDPNCKISRHHADIELKEFTGGKYYLFTDKSSNGSLVGDRLIHNGSCTIPVSEPLPIIKLANSDAGLVDWKRIQKALNAKLRGKNNNNKSTPRRKGKPDWIVPESMEEDGSVWLVAAYVFVVLGGILGIIFGTQLATAKVSYGPKHTKVFKYKKLHRQLGWGAVIAAPISMIIWLLCL